MVMKYAVFCWKLIGNLFSTTIYCTKYVFMQSLLLIIGVHKGKLAIGQYQFRDGMLYIREFCYMPSFMGHLGYSRTENLQ